MNAGGEGRSGAIDCGGRRVSCGGVFDFSDERGADNRGVHKTSENGNVTGLRNSESNRERKFGSGAHAAQKRWEIIWERILGPRDTSAGDEIEKTGRHGGDLSEALIGGCWRAEKNRVELVRSENATVVGGFFWRQIGGEDAVSSGFGSNGGEFLEARLENGIVVAEEDERDVTGLSDLADEIENTRKRGPEFQGAFGGALNGRAVGERIAKRDTEFDNVSACLGERQNKLERSAERRIARGNVRDDAHFAAGLQVGKTAGDTGRIGRCSEHKGMK